LGFAPSMPGAQIHPPAPGWHSFTSPCWVSNYRYGLRRRHMLENYEVVYTHPSGATATFIRHDGELDALAKALDSEQFWVFKNVKALLVRNEADDLAEANRLMGAIGFTHAVREITRPVPTAAREPAFAISQAAEGAPEGASEEAHAGVH